jgi:hypothetical protein
LGSQSDEQYSRGRTRANYTSFDFLDGNFFCKKAKHLTCFGSYSNSFTSVYSIFSETVGIALHCIEVPFGD